MPPISDEPVVAKFCNIIKDSFYDRVFVAKDAGAHVAFPESVV